MKDDLISLADMSTAAQASIRGLHPELLVGEPLDKLNTINLEKFRDPKLLNFIEEELSKNHLGDTNAKMTCLLTAISGLLKNPKRRMSNAIKSFSSVGKDNLIKTALKQMPRDSFAFLTSGTQAVIEDDLKDKKIIAFSEVNLGSETGANKFLLEIIKQKTEGGTSSAKKDRRTDNKTMRYDKGEQATILYGTTETQMDEQLATRFIEIPLCSDYQKIKAVNEKTFDTFSDPNKLIEDTSEEDTWIRKGLTYFYENKQFEIILPYAIFLKEKMDNQDIFDYNNPRSQRDIKRLLSLTCAMTYLFQEQRQKIEYNGKNFLVSKPIDLINTLIFSSEFFNQSYSGLDTRLSKLYDRMKEITQTKEGEVWIERDSLEGELEVSKNTIKLYCKELADWGLIEGSTGKELNEQGFNFHKSKIYYKICQKHIKKPLIRCQVSKLKSFLEEKNNLDIDTFYKNTQENISNKKVSNDTEIDRPNISGNSDTFLLTPFQAKVPKCALCNKEDAFITMPDGKIVCEDCGGLEK